MYLPAPTESANTTLGRVEPTFVAAIGTAADALMTALAGADFQWVVYSPTKQRGYAVERIIVDDLWDIQRSRRNKQANVYNDHHA